MEAIIGRYGRVRQEAYVKEAIFQIVEKVKDEVYKIKMLKYGTLKVNTKVNCTKAFIEEAEEISEEDVNFELI